MKEPVYLDNAATMSMLPTVKNVMMEAIESKLGNAAALHGMGHAAKMVIEDARIKIARLIHAEPEEIIFTSGGTESNNTVMNIFRNQKIAVSAIEHPSVLRAAEASAKEVARLEVDEWGRLGVSGLADRVRDCGLVSVMLANNELGTIEPIQEISKCCKKYNIPLHCDATQAFGKVKIDVRELGVDYLTLSAHKIGGPIGVGALYVRKGAKFTPFMLGGHQEGGRRAGTSNVVGIAGFGAVADWCWENWSCRKWAEVAKLRDELKGRILREVLYSSCNSPEVEVLPNMLNMSFRAAEGESIQLYLDAEGIIVGTGSACAAGDLSPSHVIMATKHDAEIAHSSIRFSLGLDTTRKDIERVMAVLPGIIKRLQGISTIKVSAGVCEGPKTWPSGPERPERATADTLKGEL